MGGDFNETLALLSSLADTSRQAAQQSIVNDVSDLVKRCALFDSTKIEGMAVDTGFVCIPTQKIIWREKMLAIRGHKSQVNDLG